MAKMESVLMAEVAAEVLQVKVGTLTIEASAPEPGKVMHSYGTKVLFDGQEPPFRIRKLVLTLDCDDAVRIWLEGYPCS